MRTVNFRDTVLYGIARRMGMDPRSDLLSQDTYAWVTFINLWVAKLWDKIDFPEWTLIERRTPRSNHIVSFDQANATPIGKVLKVYLGDPATTPGPLDTPFRLDSRGIHCGFDHGTYVWIKFMLRPPQYTGIPFDGSKVYKTGDLVYDPVTGEVYSAGPVAGGGVGGGGGGGNSDPLVETPTTTVGPVSVTDATTTDGSTSLTSNEAKFTGHDIGALLFGPGIPDGTTIVSITSSKEVEMSAEGTIDDTNVAVTIGPLVAAKLDDVIEFGAVLALDGDDTVTVPGAEFTAKDIGGPIQCIYFPEGTYITEVVDEDTLTLSEEATVPGEPGDVPFIVGPPNGRWQLIPFPFQLAEPVIRGAFADAQRGEGQTEKGIAEEQAAIGTVGERAAAQSGSDYDPLTDQVRRPARYAGAR